jgi:F-type H+-transporting ATPase subunit b
MFASGTESSGGETDIAPRTVHFLIFAAILYWLLADKLRAFFNGRSDEIATRLSAAQEKVKAAKLEKEEALAKVEGAKESAKEIIEIAHKEAALLSDKISDNVDNEIRNLEKSSKDGMEVEEKKMQRDVVNEVIDKMFDEDATQLTSDDFVNIINKKVA